MSEARRLYAEKKFDRSKEILDHLIEEDVGGAYGMAARYLRARGYESGRFRDGVDYENAYADFSHLADRADVFGSSGLVGEARVLLEMDAAINANEILELCERAIALDGNAKAAMIAGVACEKILRDEERAAYFYKRAFLSGLPWGLRYLAKLRWAQGRRVQSILLHAGTTLCAPFLNLYNGRIRSPFH